MFAKLNIYAGINFCAFVVGLFCLVSSLRKNLKRIQHVTYLFICISCCAAPLFLVFEELFETFGRVEDGRIGLFMAVEVFFFFFHSFLAPSYALYVMSLNGTLAGRKGGIWFVYWTPVLLVEIFNIVNIFFPPDARPLYTIVTTADGGLAYQRGDYMFILYVVAFIYIIYGLIVFIKNIKALNKKKIAALVMFNVFTLSGVFFQFFWSSIKLEAFFESMSTLGLLLLLENDGEIINHNTDLFNELAFSSDNAIAMASKRKYTIITLKTPNYYQYLEMLSDREFKAIELEIARFLTTIHKPSFIYHLTSGSFALIVYDKEKEKVEEIVEKCKKRFAEPWRSENIEATVRWIITVARVPEDIDDPSQVHYLFLGKTAKTEQRIVVRDGLSLQFIKHRSKIEGAIGRGLKDGNFKLYYQPIWDAKRDRIVSAEALLRLIDPELGLISPAEFIPVAEENGTIIEIGHWVFEEACRFATENNLERLGIEWLEINLSVYQLPEKNLPGRFLETTHRYGISPSFMNIEITESADADENTDLVSIIEGLAEVGFPLSLDDYGTGYSNLTRLVQSNFTNIKLDRSLLLSAENDKAGKKVLSKTYDTMNSLSFHTIQEGVETEEQKELVISCGAEMIQGFLFSKPIPENDFIEYVIKFNNIQYID